MMSYMHTLTCEYCHNPFAAPKANRRFCSKSHSNLGSPRGAKTRPLKDRYEEKVIKLGGCWDWTGSTNNAGYGTINSGGHDGHPLLAHRVSYELYVGPIPESVQVCHRCDNPPCSNPAHLFLGTPAVNSADQVSKGRHAWGEKNGHAKLTVESVREMRRLHFEERIPQAELGRRFGVTQGAAHCAIVGKTWKGI